MASRGNDSGATGPVDTGVGTVPEAADSRSILAVIPAYNERDSIADVISRTQPHVDSVVVVDDASEDDTADIAREQADGVVSHPENLGVGAAVHTGYRLAIREGYDRLVQIDGDGQHDPDRIPELLATMDERDADMVIGSRWLNSSHRDYTLLRRVGIRFFTMEANVLGGLDVTDVTSGYRVYDVSMLAELQRPEHDHWALEQTLEVASKDYDIAEVSVPMPPPDPATSQFSPATYAQYPLRMALSTLKVLIFR